MAWQHVSGIDPGYSTAEFCSVIASCVSFVAERTAASFVKDHCPHNILDLSLSSSDRQVKRAVQPFKQCHILSTCLCCFALEIGHSCTGEVTNAGDVPHD